MTYSVGTQGSYFCVRLAAGAEIRTLTGFVIAAACLAQQLDLLGAAFGLVRFIVRPGTAEPGGGDQGIAWFQFHRFLLE